MMTFRLFKASQLSLNYLVIILQKKAVQFVLLFFKRIPHILYEKQKQEGTI